MPSFSHFSIHFYPRPPRGGRLRTGDATALPSPFLSTPSARRATPSEPRRSRQQPYFYPRPPRGGRHFTKGTVIITSLFLSTPSARRATGPPGVGRSFVKFLSTPSARRATVANLDSGVPDGISIHALREEGDTLAWCAGAVVRHFYPRPPRGGRPLLQRWGGVRRMDFYPRPPRGGRLLSRRLWRSRTR